MKHVAGVRYDFNDLAAVKLELNQAQMKAKVVKQTTTQNFLVNISWGF